MPPPRIEVKFRGDGGPDYKGQERRGKPHRPGTPEDRVAGEIRDFVRDAIAYVHGSRRKRKLPVLTYRKVPEKPGPNVDSETFRYGTIDTAIGDAACLLADTAIRIVGLPARPSRKTKK